MYVHVLAVMYIMVNKVIVLSHTEHNEHIVEQAIKTCSMYSRILIRRRGGSNILRYIYNGDILSEFKSDVRKYLIINPI